jgi:predicted acylesterase/phospholipase RssA
LLSTSPIKKCSRVYKVVLWQHRLFHYDVVRRPYNRTRTMVAALLVNFCFLCLNEISWSQSLVGLNQLKKWQLLRSEAVNSNGLGVCVALSGGGMRAVAFHTGVLQGLHKALTADKFRITLISGVSGGAIAGAFYIKTLAETNEWSGSARSQMETFLTSSPVFRTAAANIFATLTFRSAIAEFERLLNKDLYRGLLFKDLPTLPYLVIGATDFQNSRHVLFSKLSLENQPNFRVAKAVAASAAIPLAFDPMILTNNYVPASEFDAFPERTERKAYDPQISGSAYLQDGGVVDNLALDPPSKGARALIGNRLCDVVFVSDATAPSEKKEYWRINAQRPLDVAMDRIYELQYLLTALLPSMYNDGALKFLVLRLDEKYAGAAEFAATKDLPAEKIPQLIDLGLERVRTAFDAAEVRHLKTLKDSMRELVRKRGKQE